MKYLQNIVNDYFGKFLIWESNTFTNGGIREVLRGKNPPTHCSKL
jgi:hypothetical protein